jgi:hypothetical protein
MNESFRKFDYQRELINTKRSQKWNEVADINKELVKKRSQEKLHLIREEKEED